MCRSPLLLGLKRAWWPKHLLGGPNLCLALSTTGHHCFLLGFHGTAAHRCLRRRAGESPMPSPSFLVSHTEIHGFLSLGEGSQCCTHHILVAFLVEFPVPGCQDLSQSQAVLWRQQLLPEAFWSPCWYKSASPCPGLSQSLCTAPCSHELLQREDLLFPSSRKSLRKLQKVLKSRSLFS